MFIFHGLILTEWILNTEEGRKTKRNIDKRWTEKEQDRVKERDRERGRESHTRKHKHTERKREELCANSAKGP